MKLDVRRCGVFNLVGFGGFVLQIGTIMLLSRGLGWSSIVATAAGLEVAALHNFIGHSRWTWRETPVGTPRGWAIRYGRYQLAKTTSLAASLAITMSLHGVAEMPVELASTLAVLICSLPNYLLTGHLVFGQRGMP